MQSGEERTVRVQLSGNLDISRRDEVAALLPDPLSAERVVIDCSGVEAMDSTIISVFMRYRRTFMQAGGDPINIIVVLPPMLRRVFEIVGLARTLTIVSAAPPERTESTTGPASVETQNGDAV